MDDLAHAVWRKSNRSGSGNECAEVVTLANGRRAVRDSKNPAGPALWLNSAGWAAFTAGVRDGEFD